MQKTIHVNAYVRKDGTPVKEHYRTIDGIDNIIIYDENGEPQNPWPNGDIPTVELPDEDSDSTQEEKRKGDIGSVIAGVIVIAAEIVKIIAAIFGAGNNAKQIQNLENDLDSAVSGLVKLQKLSEQNFQKNLDRLVKTKDKQEYSNLYKTVQEHKQINDKLKYTVSKISYASQHRDAEAIKKELSNFKSDFDEVINRYSNEHPLQTISSINWDNGNIQKNIFNLDYYKGKFIKPLIDIGSIGFNNTYKIPNFKAFWDIASSDFKKSKEYIEYNGVVVESIKNLPTQELRKTVSRKLKEQFGIEDTIGVIFKSHSDVSRLIAKSPEIKEFFLINKDILLNMKVVKDKSTFFSNNKDLGYSLGKADILYAYIDEDGNLILLVFDTYDFNKNDPDWKVRRARDVQTAGIIRWYYTLTVVNIPISEWLSWLNNI